MKIRTHYNSTVAATALLAVSLVMGGCAALGEDGTPTPRPPHPLPAKHDLSPTEAAAYTKLRAIGTCEYDNKTGSITLLNNTGAKPVADYTTIPPEVLHPPTNPEFLVSGERIINGKTGKTEKQMLTTLFINDFRGACTILTAPSREDVPKEYIYVLRDGSPLSVRTPPTPQK